MKPLDQLTQADIRSPILAPSIQIHHQRIESLALDSQVPDEIRRHFEVARDLLLFSWFVYEFIPAAELHAYSSVEFALRLTAETHAPNRKSHSLARLLRYAVDEGWIVDRGFRQFRRIEEGRQQSMRIWAEVIGQPTSLPTQTDPQGYAKIILNSIPYFRNKLAHGSSFLSPHGYLSLELCRDIINQLFMQPFQGIKASA